MGWVTQAISGPLISCCLVSKATIMWWWQPWKNLAPLHIQQLLIRANKHWGKLIRAIRMFCCGRAIWAATKKNQPEWSYRCNMLQFSWTETHQTLKRSSTLAFCSCRIHARIHNHLLSYKVHGANVYTPRYDLLWHGGMDKHFLCHSGHGWRTCIQLHQTLQQNSKRQFSKIQMNSCMWQLAYYREWSCTHMSKRLRVVLCLSRIVNKANKAFTSWNTAGH